MKLILNWLDLAYAYWLTFWRQILIGKLSHLTSASLSLSHIAKHLGRQGSGENEEWIHLNIRRAANLLNS